MDTLELLTSQSKPLKIVKVILSSRLNKDVESLKPDQKQSAGRLIPIELTTIQSKTEVTHRPTIPTTISLQTPDAHGVSLRLTLSTDNIIRVNYNRDASIWNDALQHSQGAQLTNR